MNEAFNSLKQAVEKEKTVVQSAILLINGLKARLDDAIASGDPGTLQALSNQLLNDSQALADAVAANTPESGNDQPPAEPNGSGSEPNDNPPPPAE